MDTDSFIVYIKATDICVDITKGVEKKTINLRKKEKK